MLAPKRSARCSVLLLSAACALSAAACGSGDDEPREASASGGAAGAGGTSGAGGAAGGSGAGGGGGQLPAPEPEGCLDDVTPGQHAFTCDSIVFDLSVPERCLRSVCGLIVDVHGFSMSAAMQDASTELRRRGAEKGYVVLQPNADPAPPLSSWDGAGGDDPAVFAMLERTMRVFHLDPKRVHFTGFSQGGGMTWRMLCAHADVFASVAPAAMAEGCSFQGAEVPSRQVPTLFLHGTTDGLVPFDGALALRDAIVAAWSLDSGTRLAGDTDFDRTRYVTPEGVPFEFLTHDYQQTTSCLVLELKGHCFPGSEDPGTATGQACSFACPPPNAFDWGEEVMGFFEAHPMP